MSDFESLLAKNTPEGQDLASMLHTPIFRQPPDAWEKVITGWDKADFISGGLS